ncbi:MAG: RibD family protein, partial [Flavisolibacter sp.]
CRDPFIKVNGKGIEKLKESGIDVITNICENECKEINKRFFTFHTQHRPFIVLKWAQSMDGKIANEDYSRLFISNEFTNRMVHKWRSEEMAILIGTNTAFFDDPSLTVRHWPGQNPIRLVLDMHLRLPENLKLFKTSVPTIVFNAHKHSLPFGNVSTTDLRNLGLSYYQITEDVNIVHQLVNAIYSLGIQSVLIEGGAQLLQSFIDENCWDESRLIVNEQLFVGNGFPAPILNGFTEISKESYYSDVVRVFKNNSLTV